MDKNIQDIIDKFCFEPNPQQGFKESKTLSYLKKKYIEFIYNTDYKVLTPTMNNYFIPKHFTVDVDRRDPQLNNFIKKINENAWNIKIIPNEPVRVKAYYGIEMEMFKNMKFYITASIIRQRQITRYFINTYTFTEVTEEDFFDFLKKEKNKDMYYKFYIDKERDALQHIAATKNNNLNKFKL